MKKIPLNKGKISEFVIVDDEDFDFLSQWNWTIRRMATVNYARRTETTLVNGRRKNKTIHMHRVVLKLHDDTLIVDHVNGDGLDNRKCNVRACTYSQNHQNRHKSRQARKGVRQSSANRWQARIVVNGNEMHLGSFRSENEAAKAYADAARMHFGEFARPT